MVASLHVQGTKLVSKDLTPVRLRGISTHGIHWFPQYVNKQSFETLRDEWKANVIRLAMYVEEGGYAQDGGLNGQSYKKMIEGIDACIALDMYCIVDWHVSNADQTPMKHKDAAKEFFGAIVDKYGNDPHLLFEICNEPTNAGNDYATQIAPYADELIALIRAKAPDAVVIIGSGEWSKHPVEAWQYDQGKRKNVLYTLHRYDDGDFDSWSPAIAAGVAAGCPIFATEAGDSNSGEWNWGTVEEFQKIIAFFEANAIPWTIWSLADKKEPSSILEEHAPGSGSWTEFQISAAGKVVRDDLRKYADVAPKPLPPEPAPAPAPVPPPVAGAPKKRAIKGSIELFGLKMPFSVEMTDDEI